MTEVTPASLAYVANQVLLLPFLLQRFSLFIQVRFALSSSSVFSKSDLVTDSERFYLSVLEELESEEAQEDWNTLKDWWNRLEFGTFNPEFA